MGAYEIPARKIHHHALGLYNLGILAHYYLVQKLRESIGN